MSDTGAELGQRQGAALADPRGNTRQVDGEGPGQPPPPATLCGAVGPTGLLCKFSPHGDEMAHSWVGVVRVSKPPGTLAEALIRLQASLPRITKDDAAPIGAARVMGWYGVAADIVSERGCVRFDVDRSTVFRCDPADAVQLAVLLLSAAERAAQ